MADCSEYQNSVVNCICKPGYTGNGYGATGCTLSNDTSACPIGFCQVLYSYCTIIVFNSLFLEWRYVLR